MNEFYIKEELPPENEEVLFKIRLVGYMSDNDMKSFANIIEEKNTVVR